MNIGVIGVGHVGAALLTQIAAGEAEIQGRLGEPLRVRRAVVRTPHAPRPCPPPDLGYTTDVEDLLRDPHIHVVVELAGGPEWFPVLTRVLASRRPVVTANKALLAERGAELQRTARRSETALFQEAAVGGAIPIMRVLARSRAGENIRYVGGVLNGTANYLLGAMSQGHEYALALQQAQRLGYAESDPTDDVDGMDTARKLSILVQAAFGADIPPTSWPLRGIRGLSAPALTRLQPHFAVKLLAQAWRQDGQIQGLVGPTLIPRHHLFAGPQGPENAVLVAGDPGGPTGLLGLGAGGAATASAVLSDVLEAAAVILGAPPPYFPTVRPHRAEAPRLYAFVHIAPDDDAQRRHVETVAERRGWPSRRSRSFPWGIAFEGSFEGIVMGPLPSHELPPGLLGGAGEPLWLGPGLGPSVSPLSAPELERAGP